jgi:hypothetical protein
MEGVIKERYTYRLIPGKEEPADKYTKMNCQSFVVKMTNLFTDDEQEVIKKWIDDQEFFDEFMMDK